CESMKAHMNKGLTHETSQLGISRSSNVIVGRDKLAFGNIPMRLSMGGVTVSTNLLQFTNQQVCFKAVALT
ncbi:hypothetical protein KI387_016932, partial [Taxus chinensis]